MGSIMVLPVNWRESLAFEEGGYSDGPDDGAGFGLEDITPDTLPSIRSLVSDVMLDVPYYMSHHQPKMIAAVIREANRVYQLWCKNNPGFAQRGRVHIIAHSLGSVMSIDILSRQPTKLPAQLSDPSTIDLEKVADLDHFLFNTSNLFLAGSPAGFFLLLKKAQLLPRIDSTSKSAEQDPSSNNLSICGERGTYGCIAVENVYNIVNGYDPVAYRMNAAVDSVFAVSLKKAMIPSASASWFRNNSTTSATSTSWFAGSGGSSTNAPPPLPRLPSNVELEIHNFTREEVAEKRMLLLNDNGQIDFYLRYGGGPLEIQYLTMLGAHSSYWLLKDFTRMIVLEVGRASGKAGTLTGMRAIKKPIRNGK
nr:putative phospholipase [Quercus suber]